ncbi:hypothetical protein ACL2XQ_15715 [Sodalis sp. RH14]|uniref:IclR family transcriptional regulator domain-containing protein n=1 Tax=Sodalis sp. RH14 TaxID=3394329 RepID=UPI0039B5FF3E
MRAESGRCRGAGVRLGWGLNELAKMSYCHIAAKIRHPFETLFAATYETIDISTLRGREVYFLDRIASDQLVRVVPTIDRPKPLYAMANGKVILSHSPALKLALSTVQTECQSILGIRNR